MIGNNSCGAHSVLGGKTSENIEELHILTYDGLRFTVGATGDRELKRITQAGGCATEIYQRLHTPMLTMFGALSPRRRLSQWARKKSVGSSRAIASA